MSLRLALVATLAACPSPRMPVPVSQTAKVPIAVAGTLQAFRVGELHRETEPLFYAISADSV